MCIFDPLEDILGETPDFDGDGELSFGDLFIAHELFESDEVLAMENDEEDGN